MKVRRIDVISEKIVVVKRVLLKLFFLPGLLLEDLVEFGVTSDEALDTCAIFLLLGRHSIAEPLVLVIELYRAAILNFFTLESVVDLVFRHIVVLLHSHFIKPSNHQL